MNEARPLPAYLIQRFHGWRATSYQDNKAWFKRLAESGQHPRANGDFVLRQPGSCDLDLWG